MTNPSRDQIELVDGGALTATEIKAVLGQLPFFTAGPAGGTLYVTVNGRRRWAAVPVAIADAYLAAKTLAAGLVFVGHAYRDTTGQLVILGGPDQPTELPTDGQDLATGQTEDTPEATDGQE